MAESNFPNLDHRAHETTVTLDAPIEEVWTILTQADAIAWWFAPKVTVDPGKGGSIVADWGPGLEWKTAIEVCSRCATYGLSKPETT
jgi:uncharacterized protein YndB with AHSA1/START domain